jgi:8-hydroxy-5-deazaflavin:NADPH oxidoreductase
MKKTFGIIGAGNIGQTVARHLAKAGYPVILSNSQGPDSLKDIIGDIGSGVTAGTAADAAAADIVLLALPWSQISTLTALTDWKGKSVIDATNHFVSFVPEFKLADIGDKASTEVVAEYVPGANVVKSFNTLYFKILGLDPQEGKGRRVMFVSGNEAASKKEVTGVIESLGFAVIDLGSLAHGSKLQQPGGAVATLNLVKY